MPATVYLITGGCRSGKSSHAQHLCEKLCADPIYLATSKAWDDDFRDRVRRHRRDRGDHWTTIEEPLRPSEHSASFGGRAVLVDCLTLWLTNYFMEAGAFTEPDGDKNATASDDADDVRGASERALALVKAEFDRMVAQWDATFVFVTNEIGSGLHADGAASRRFVDAQGWLNQHVASRADAVIHMVAGVATVIKRPPADRRDPLRAPGDGDLAERAMLDTFLSARGLAMDDKGYFLLKLDHAEGAIRATYHSCIKNDRGEICDANGIKIKCDDGGDGRPAPMAVFEGRTAKELTVAIFERWEHAGSLVSVGHAAYIGREAQRAEQCLFAGKFYQQD